MNMKLYDYGLWIKYFVLQHANTTRYIRLHELAGITDSDYTECDLYLYSHGLRISTVTIFGDDPSDDRINIIRFINLGIDNVNDVGHRVELIKYLRHYTYGGK
jgi:hypothetical protein